MDMQEDWIRHKQGCARRTILTSSGLQVSFPHSADHGFRTERAISLGLQAGCIRNKVIESLREM